MIRSTFPPLDIATHLTFYLPLQQIGEKSFELGRFYFMFLIESEIDFVTWLLGSPRQITAAVSMEIQ